MTPRLLVTRWSAWAVLVAFLTHAGVPSTVLAEEPGPNLVVNPSFERGDVRPAAWLFNSGNGHFGALRVDRAGRGDDRCARLESFSSHYAQFVAQDVRVRRPGRYRAGGWVRLGGGFVRLRVIGRDAKGASSFHKAQPLRCYRGHPLVPDFVPIEDTQGVHDTQWRCLQTLVDVKPGVETIRVEIGFYFTPGRAWVDDVFLTPTSENELPSVAPEPSGPALDQIRGDWVAEWDSPRIARVGLRGAVERVGGKPASRPLCPGNPYESGFGVALSDGKRDGKAVVLADAQIKRSGEGLALLRPFGDETGSLSETIANRDGRTSWRATVRNDSDVEKWLEVDLGVRTGLAGGARFWDGAEESPVKRLWRRRDGPIFMFPVACAYDASDGLALGIEPYRDFSHLAFGTREREGNVELYCALRIVIEPRSSRSIDFVAFRFAPRWAWREAVQVYYDLFPDFTRPTPGTDPRLVGTDGYVYASVATRHLQMEECRRFRIRWEWVYGPFQTPGDWYPDEKHWDPKKRYTGPTDLHHNEVRGTLDDYRRVTRNRFHRGRHACAMLFYLIPQACERRFLEQEYPDSWWIRADGSHWINRKGYVKVDGATAWAWPLNTSYGRATLDDIRRIVKDFKPSGFAFDVAHGFVPYYGPAQKGLPGRTWTGGKSMVRESIALGALIDEIHEMKSEGHTVGVCVNGPYTYMMGRRTDVTMFEPPSYEWQHYISRQWPVRLVSGRKLVNWHAGHGRLRKAIRWRELPPKTIERDLRGTIDFTLLWSLWLGAAPSAPDLRGFPKACRWMPMLIELARAGWQPVPAVEAHEALLTSRYGDGVGGFVALSNPTRPRIAGRARVQSCYLGTGAFLFSRYDGEPVPCESDGDYVELNYDLASREALVCRTLLEVSGAGAIRGTVEFDPAPLRLDKLVAKFSAARAGMATVRLGLPDGARVQRVRCNDAVQGDALEFRAPLQRRNLVIVEYEPKVVVICAKDELLGYPLMRDGKAACAIVVARPERDRVTAERLAAYIEYYLRRQTDPGRRCWGLTEEREGVQPTILNVGDPVPDGLGVILVGAEAAAQSASTIPVPTNGGTISIVEWQNRRALLVAGSSPELTEEASFRLMELFDERYPFFGVLPNRPFYERAGLAGQAMRSRVDK